jgi:hypothetical protein
MTAPPFRRRHRRGGRREPRRPPFLRASSTGVVRRSPHWSAAEMRAGGPGFPQRSNPGYGDRFLFAENESSGPWVADRFVRRGLSRRAVRHPGRLIRRAGRDGGRGRGGNETWPRARSEQRRQRSTSEAKESPWRPTKIVAVPRKARNQFVGDIDFDDRLLGTGPELPHGFPGLIAQLAVDAARQAIEPPEFDLRLPYLFGRIGRRAGRGRLAWLDGPSTPL